MKQVGKRLGAPTYRVRAARIAHQERYTTTLCCLAQYDPDHGGCQACGEMLDAFDLVDPDGAVTILLDYACQRVLDAECATT